MRIFKPILTDIGWKLSMTFSKEALISLREAQRSLGNPARSTLYRWIAEGQIPPPVRIGGRIFWRSGELDAFICNLKSASRALAEEPAKGAGA